MTLTTLPSEAFDALTAALDDDYTPCDALRRLAEQPAVFTRRGK